MAFSNADFPNLHPGNHQITSPTDKWYNCIAWAAGRIDEWWDPAPSADPARKHQWPTNAPRDYNLTSLIIVFESVGFATCSDDSPENGVEKIAIYADGPEYTHAARQLESGKWTSKIGELEDIEHDVPEDLAGPCYGQVAMFMKRQRGASEAQ